MLKNHISRRTSLLVALVSAFCLQIVLSSMAEAGFVDVSASVGLIQEKRKSWGNPVWGDFNNDGYLDLIVPTHGLLAPPHGPLVYLNNTGISFTDIRSTCGITRGPELDDGDWHGYAMGDYDGDGNLDVYVAEGAKGNQGGTIKRDLLFQGHGDGTFTYESDAAGLEVTDHRGRCAAFFDYNNDGQLDIFTKNYSGTNPLYRNEGAGSYSIISDYGLDLASDGTDDGSLISFADYDNDSYMDVLMTGDGNTEALYHNNGDGTWSEVTAAAGLTPHDSIKGVAWGDYDNDGYLDLCLTLSHQGDSSAGIVLLHNNGNETFTEVTDSAGVSVTASCWAAVWGDYDNDGHPDLFVTNAGITGEGPGNHNFLFHNNGNGTFTDAAASQGVAAEDEVSLHKLAAWGDFDNDGFLDLLLKDGIGNEGDQGDGALGYHFLYRNHGNGNHYLKVSLHGTISNLKGIGARVTVTSSNGLTFGENTGGGGGEYASQGSEPLHFGIGTANSATIAIIWPSGTHDVFRNIAANSTISLVEGTSAQTTPPQITKQPANRTVSVGDKARFAVGVSGSEPFTYQWRRNGIKIAGATDYRYQTDQLTAEDNGSLYSVIVSNAAGDITSRNAKLTVTGTSPKP